MKKTFWLAVFLMPWLTGCQIGYYMHSAYHQTKLLNDRESIAKVLKSGKLTDEEKRKLELVTEVKKFCEEDLGLKHSDNYTSFVKLDRPYVTYIVQAAYARELKPYLWKFPFVGQVPYKGYFRKELAEEEARSFKPEEFDTFVRGVSAYSTLGWFQDSVLSSMLRFEDFDLVELIIHETIHTTLFIKNAAEFNERLANFLGMEGMKLFYLKKEGAESPNLKKAEVDARDRKLFSDFLTKEIESLKIWYAENKDTLTADSKAARLKQIQENFTKTVRPKMDSGVYKEFERRPLNNAHLLALQTYEYDMAAFEKVHDHFGRKFQSTLDYFKSLEKDPHPDQTLKDFALRLSSH